MIKCLSGTSSRAKTHVSVRRNFGNIKDVSTTRNVQDRKNTRACRKVIIVMVTISTFALLLRISARPWQSAEYFCTTLLRVLLSASCHRGRTTRRRYNNFPTVFQHCFGSGLQELLTAIDQVGSSTPFCMVSCNNLLRPGLPSHQRGSLFRGRKLRQPLEAQIPPLQCWNVADSPIP